MPGKRDGYTDRMRYNVKREAALARGIGPSRREGLGKGASRNSFSSIAGMLSCHGRATPDRTAILPPGAIR